MHTTEPVEVSGGNPDGFLEHRPVNDAKILTKAQALELLRKIGYSIADDVTVTA